MLVNFTLLTFTKTMRLLNTLACKIQEFLEHSSLCDTKISQGQKEIFQRLKDGQSWSRFAYRPRKTAGNGYGWIYAASTKVIARSYPRQSTRCINNIEAEFCIAYLADISVIKDETGTERKCLYETEWFKRGWTLQELLVSRDVVFYDTNWKIVGTRTGLEADVSHATSISARHLSRPSEASVAAIMS